MWAVMMGVSPNCRICRHRLTAITGMSAFSERSDSLLVPVSLNALPNYLLVLTTRSTVSTPNKSAPFSNQTRTLVLQALSSALVLASQLPSARMRCFERNVRDYVEDNS